ncbi:MAG: LPS assembly lipoprotein LptE [bacterium]|jgi:TolB-like protein|nr:LPS assembly lipoprotein LptE [bacterium]
MKIKIPIIILMFLSIANTRCGYYSFSGSTLPSHLGTIAIPIFENRTTEFGVPEDLTEALITKFTEDNSLKVVDRGSADSIIEGSIVNVREQAGAYTSQEQVKEIRIYIRIQAKFEDVKKNKVMWEEEITQWGTYNPDLPLAQEGSSRQDAIREALEKISTDIFNKTIAGW